MSTTSSILDWHRACRPSPTDDDLRVQIGCHLEECAEMLGALAGADGASDVRLRQLTSAIAAAANDLKSGRIDIAIGSRRDLLDALCDQIVTAIGIAHCAHLQIEPALAEVNRSNWSKLQDGKPLRDRNGKIIKGPNYTPPRLESYA